MPTHRLAICLRAYTTHYGARLGRASARTDTEAVLSAASCLRCRIWSEPAASSVLLDGSFVTQKDLPEDYDGTWDTTGVDPYRLDPVLLDFSNARAAMKSKYLGELFPATATAAPGVLYRDFFMKDRNGVPKGVVNIDLRSLP